MKISKKLLGNFIAEVYVQEKDHILNEIKLEESKKELLSFVKSELNESKIRNIISSKILKEFDPKKYDNDDDEDDDEDDIFSQSMKSSASGGNIKVMTAYGDADHPDHDIAVKLVQKAKEKDPDLRVPDPGHAGSGSSGETGKKSKSGDPDNDIDTGTVFKDTESSYKDISGDDTEDPKNRPGYIYGDDEISLPSFARDLPLYWKRKQAAGEEEEVMSSSPVKTFVYKSKKKKKGPRISPGGFR